MIKFVLSFLFVLLTGVSVYAQEVNPSGVNDAADTLPLVSDSLRSSVWNSPESEASFDSARYYSALADKFLAYGHEDRLFGKRLMMISGITCGVSVPLLLLSLKSYYGKPVFVAGAAILAVGTLMLPVGIGYKISGSADIRRGEQFRKQLDLYKLRTSNGVSLRMAPLIDPFNKSMGGLLALNF